MSLKHFFTHMHIVWKHDFVVPNVMPVNKNIRHDFVDSLFNLYILQTEQSKK